MSLATAPVPPVATASSHREAPLITQDPRADGTDFYMFTSPEDNGSVTFVANYIPLQVPYAGPNFYSFDPDVVYAVRVDNNGDNTEDITFEFRFRTEVAQRQHLPLQHRAHREPGRPGLERAPVLHPDPGGRRRAP